jgi:hypothetical protein
MGVLLLLYFHYLSLLELMGCQEPGSWLVMVYIVVGHRQMQNCKAALENGAR